MACKFDELIQELSAAVEGKPGVPQELRTLLAEGRSLASKEEIVLGSKEEVVYQMGDRYPGADTAYWANVGKQQDNKVKALVGTRVMVENLEINSAEFKTVKSASSTGGIAKVTFDDNTSMRVDLETGMDGTGYKYTQEFMLGSDLNSNETMFRDEHEVAGHGDVEKMSQLVKELNELDPNPANAKHVAHLQGLIQNMDNTFFTEMKTFVDENADSTLGRITNTKININVSKFKQLAANTQSAAEAYAHEVTHAFTMFGLRGNSTEASKIRRELRYLRNVVAKGMKWEDFLPAVSLDAKVEEENAKAMWKYVFENDTAEGIDEFIAHVLTNEVFLEKTKELKIRQADIPITIFDRIMELFGTVMDVLRGKYDFSSKDKNVLEEVVALTQRLGAINNDALVVRNENRSVVGRLGEWFNTAEFAVSDKLIGGLTKLEDKLDNVKPLPRNASKWEYTKWLARWLPQLATKSELKPYLSLVLTGLGMKPEGTVQNIIRDFRTPGTLERALDALNMQSSKVDRTREDIVRVVKEQVLAGFTKKLTSKEESALTAVLIDVDIQSIYDEYSNAKLADMLTDETVLDTEIGKAKAELKKISPEAYKWNVSQASGLGYYLGTGNAHEAQNLNASNIATGVLFQLKEAKVGEEQAIDRVATLMGLKYTDKYKKKIAGKLVKEQKQGIDNIIGIHKNFAEESKEKLFDGIATNQIKGYSKEIFNDSIKMEVAPKSAQAEMEKAGFERVGDIDGDNGLGMETMAIYRSKGFNRQEYYRTATRITGMSKRGTSLTDVAYRANEGTDAEILGIASLNKSKMDLKRQQLITQMLKGEFDVTKVKYGKAPLLNESGDVVDYRFMMRKDVKEDVFEQNTKISHILGRSVGSIYDKVSTAEHNKIVMDTIIADMDENYVDGRTLGLNDYEYVTIGKSENSKLSREIWKVLPKALKHQIEQQGVDGKIAVRRDMFLNYFGFRHLSLVDTKLAQILPKAVRTFIKVIEELWQAIVSIAKVDILIRVPTVIIGNLMSNFVFGVMTGTNPVELVKLYVEESRNIREYMNSHKEYVGLVAAQKSGNVLNRDVKKIARLKADLEANPIHELMEAGIYESIIEDLNEEDAKTNNVVGKLLQEKTKNLPQGVKTAWNWFTLNDQTSYYKNMEMMLRMGDLLGQAVENKKRKILNEKKLKEVEKQLKSDGLSGGALLTAMNKRRTTMDKQRLESVSDDFIYYSKPASSLEEYMNRMGLMMFTKYAKRIQRVTGKTFLEHPLRSMLIATMDGYLFSDGLETIMDQTVVNRSWYNYGLDPTVLLERVVPIGIRMMY